MIRLLVSCLLLLSGSAWSADTNGERRVEPIRFAEGQTAAAVKGRIAGRTYVDHTLRAGAGQTLSVSLESANRSIYFNLLPPGSKDVAMARGEFSENRFSGVLPDDGRYTVRVYLVRAAARRGAAADYALKVGVDGTALAPRSARDDAVVKGTRYHATTTTACAPAYSQVRECAAGVVRRGFDGTATVELRWADGGMRRILFVKGEAKAADSYAAMKSTRNERGWTVEFDGGERFEIPEPLVMGG